MPTKLGESLSRSRLPDSAERRQQVLDLLADPIPPEQGRRRRAGAALLALAVALGLAATPPGQAAVEAVGELVGIGDPPSDAPFVPVVGPNSAGVVATGETSEGTEFEVVLAADRPEDQDAIGCLYVSFPDPELYPLSASCLTRAALRALEEPASMNVFSAIQRTGAGPEVSLLVTATASSDIVAGKLVAEGQDPIEVDMTAVGFEAPNAGRRGADGEPKEPIRVTHMVGFLPSSVLGEPDLDKKPGSGTGGTDPVAGYPEVVEALDRIRIEGSGADGEPIAEKRIDNPGSPWAAVQLSELLFEQSQPDTPREIATRECAEALAEKGEAPLSLDGALRRERAAYAEKLEACVAERLGDGDS